MRLDVKALALALGIIFGIFTLAIGFVAVATGVGRDYLNLVGGLHPGYSPTVLGIFIMAFWMFVYGLIGGGLFTVIYNFFAPSMEEAFGHVT
ncbi:MAG: hypothetical protein ABFC38_07030 [Methanospirillum sp.]